MFLTSFYNFLLLGAINDKKVMQFSKTSSFIAGIDILIYILLFIVFILINRKNNRLNNGFNMTLSEEAISYLEEHIPELAIIAFRQAYWSALASGSSVLMVENGDLVEIFPDGKRKFIKHLPPAIPVTKGERIEINE